MAVVKRTLLRLVVVLTLGLTTVIASSPIADAGQLCVRIRFPEPVPDTDWICIPTA